MKLPTIKFIKLVPQSTASTTACEFNIHSYLKCPHPCRLWLQSSYSVLLWWKASFVGVTSWIVRMHSNVATAPQFQVTWASVHKPTLELLRYSDNLNIWFSHESWKWIYVLLTLTNENRNNINGCSWNHFKVIQEVSERRKSRNYRKEPYWALDIFFENFSVKVQNVLSLGIILHIT